MNFFICPICGEKLEPEGGSLLCKNRHCFDLSKRKYVNLLRPSKSAGIRHGDDKAMVHARSAFLDAGYYEPLLKKITEAALSHAKDGMTVADAGCGEGYYTSHLQKALATRNPEIYGIDVSKDAIHAASVRDHALHLAVASIFTMPFADSSISMLFNLFAPYSAEEFHRVLQDKGILIRVFPAEKHLFGMKEKIYDVPYENEIDSFDLPGFTLLQKEIVRFPLHITDKNHIAALFMMTPYYYKTSREGQAKLFSLEKLDCEAVFYLTVYQKEPPCKT